MWDFCPSLGASILFIVLFTATTVIHLIQAIFYKKPYCWVIVVSGLLQAVTYVFRTISIETPSNFPYYATWFVVILVAPLWTNAFAYMVFGRIVWTYTDDHQVWGVKAQYYGFGFVVLDIVAFVVQVYGAVQATGSDAPYSQVLQGLHIYLGGIGIQLFFILVFSLFGLRCYLSLKKGTNGPRQKAAIILLYSQFVVLFLIAVSDPCLDRLATRTWLTRVFKLRIVFRIIEYSHGLDSSIPNHEAYQYTLDSLPMLVALVVYNVVHPGRVLHDTTMPSIWRGMRTGTKRRNSAISLSSQSRGHST